MRGAALGHAAAVIGHHRQQAVAIRLGHQIDRAALIFGVGVLQSIGHQLAQDQRQRNGALGVQAQPLRRQDADIGARVQRCGGGGQVAKHVVQLHAAQVGAVLQGTMRLRHRAHPGGGGLQRGAGQRVRGAAGLQPQQRCHQLQAVLDPVIGLPRQHALRRQRLAQRVLGLAAVLDIGAGADPVAQRSGGIRHRCALDAKPAPGAIGGALEPHIHVQLGASGAHRGPVLAEPPGILRVQHLGPAGHRGGAAIVAPAGVQVFHVAGRVGLPDTMRHGLRQAAEARLAGTERGLGTANLAHVAPGDDAAGDTPGAVADGAGVAENGNQPAIGAAQLPEGVLHQFAPRGGPGQRQFLRRGRRAIGVAHPPGGGVQLGALAQHLVRAAPDHGQPMRADPAEPGRAAVTDGQAFRDMREQRVQRGARCLPLAQRLLLRRHVAALQQDAGYDAALAAASAAPSAGPTSAGPTSAWPASAGPAAAQRRGLQVPKARFIRSQPQRLRPAQHRLALGPHQVQQRHPAAHCLARERLRRRQTHQVGRVTANGTGKGRVEVGDAMRRTFEQRGRHRQVLDQGLDWFDIRRGRDGFVRHCALLLVRNIAYQTFAGAGSHVRAGTDHTGVSGCAATQARVRAAVPRPRGGQAGTGRGTQREALRRLDLPRGAWHGLRQPFALHHSCGTLPCPSQTLPGESCCTCATSSCAGTSATTACSTSKPT